MTAARQPRRSRAKPNGPAHAPAADAAIPGVPWLLSPHDIDEFAARTWDRKPLYIRRSDPDYYRDILTLDDLDSVIAYSIPKDDTGKAPPVMVVENRKHAQAPPNLAGGGRYYDAYARGSTLVFNSLHRRWTPVGKLCRAVSEHFRCPVIGNAYLTPKDAQGFPPHVDTHDVFVLQLHGEKTWRLRGVGSKRPLGPPHRMPAIDVKALPRGSEVTMRPGDALYIPRGLVHEAHTAHTSSLHLTIAVLAFTVEDLLIEAVRSLAERREDLRQHLSPASSTPDRAAMSPRLARKLLHFDARALEAAQQRLEARRVHEESWTMPGGRFEAIDRIGDLDPTTRVVKRWGMPSSAVADAGSVVFGFPGELMVSPRAVAAALAFIRDHDAFRVGDLPGLHDHAKQILVGRMITSGLLEVDPETPAVRRERRLPRER
ncbi:MAG TPA: cupin domain-containing protein [Kofleriaceae bacterium]|jgi:ribosomal protein L16 Arg81 hydroxylase|nr:cupin domain-containing protein [Kofleriaceae bacterium]